MILDLQESFALFGLHEAIFARLALGLVLEITMFVLIFFFIGFGAFKERSMKTDRKVGLKMLAMT